MKEQVAKAVGKALLQIVVHAATKYAEYLIHQHFEKKKKEEEES